MYVQGYSGKALGMGVAAGFLGGAALGAVGTMAMYSTYHRYNMYRQMMYMNNPMMHGYNAGYYNNYYNQSVLMSETEDDDETVSGISVVMAAP